MLVVKKPAGSQKQAKKQNKLLKFNEFREFLFSGKTSKTADFSRKSGEIGGLEPILIQFSRVEL